MSGRTSRDHRAYADVPETRGVRSSIRRLCPATAAGLSRVWPLLLVCAVLCLVLSCVHPLKHMLSDKSRVKTTLTETLNVDDVLRPVDIGAHAIFNINTRLRNSNAHAWRKQEVDGSHIGLDREKPRGDLYEVTERSQQVPPLQPPRQEVVMDTLNPYRHLVSGDTNYSFFDYFDYVDMSDWESESKSSHTLGIIVPFRNANTELQQFVPYLHRFLTDQHVRHVFYIINQVDSLRFNRASLLNVGFLEMLTEGRCDYFAMHDVDLLPVNPEIRYHYPASGPLHLASPRLHPLYSKPDFVGAILLMTNEQYIRINGMSNTFWGWGREDEEFRMRLRKGKLKIYRPAGVQTDRHSTFIHLHDVTVRKRDRKVYGQQYRARFQFDNATGLNTTKYKVISKYNKVIGDTPYTMIDVELYCDLDLSPWCMTPKQLKEYNPSLTADLTATSLPNDQRRKRKITRKVVQQRKSAHL